MRILSDKEFENLLKISEIKGFHKAQYKTLCGMNIYCYNCMNKVPLNEQGEPLNFCSCGTEISSPV